MNSAQPQYARGSLFAQVLRMIGDAAAAHLVADFGGRRLYIPVAPGRGDLVTRSIGLAAALELAQLFGGDRLQIPPTCGHAHRRARILAMRAEGVSISRIAHELQCTERYVYKVLAVERSSAQRASRINNPTAASGRGCAGGERAAQGQATSAPAAFRTSRGHQFERR